MHCMVISFSGCIHDIVVLSLVRITTIKNNCYSLQHVYVQQVCGTELSLQHWDSSCHALHGDFAKPMISIYTIVLQQLIGKLVLQCSVCSYSMFFFRIHLNNHSMYGCMINSAVGNLLHRQCYMKHCFHLAVHFSKHMHKILFVTTCDIIVYSPMIVFPIAT